MLIEVLAKTLDVVSDDIVWVFEELELAPEEGESF